MPDQFSRTRLLIGGSGVEALKKARVAVFGVGGVGGYAVEALARCGVGALDLIDNDVVSLTNLNRQIYALHSTLGRFKTDVARERVLDINPACEVRTYRVFFTPETADEFDFAAYDCVIDAIDTVTGKIELVMRAQAAGAPIISSMGAGNKMDPSAFEAADIYKTSVCPLARVMRRELKARGVKSLRVVYSKEPPVTPLESGEDAPERIASRRSIPGSVAFVPSAAGLIIAGEAVKVILAAKQED